jgi:hypothetical protein
MSLHIGSTHLRANNLDELGKRIFVSPAFLWIEIRVSHLNRNYSRLFQTAVSARAKRGLKRLKSDVARVTRHITD